MSALLALCCMAGGAVAAAGQTGDTCPADSQFEFLCGAERPEDLVMIPGTGWMIASGFAPGAGLKLVDTQAMTMRRWFTGTTDQIGHDARRYPQCIRPVSPDRMNMRGLSLRQTGRRRWQLLAVNHGERESVEVFTVLADGRDAPRLIWRGCLPLPAGQVGNSVASFRDGTILVTVLNRPGTSIADFVRGERTGDVWQWRPGGTAFERMPGTHLPGNNGIETDPDGRHYYVVAFGWHAVARFDRWRTEGPVARIVAPDFMPDNIRWTGGRLLITGMRLDEPACGGLRRIVNGVADPMLCPRGWSVGAVNLSAGRVDTVASGGPSAHFNGHSAAAIDDAGRLWLGSFQSSRIARVREDRADARTGQSEEDAP